MGKLDKEQEARMAGMAYALSLIHIQMCIRDRYSSGISTIKGCNYIIY